MIKLVQKVEDKRYIFLYGDDRELKMLEKHLNKIPSYMFLPSFSGIPRPEVFLNKIQLKGQWVYYCFSGLFKEVKDWCEANGIVIDGLSKEMYRKPMVGLEEFKLIVSSWGLKYDPRPYQIEAAWKILNYRYSLSQLATRAGKTLIAYMVFRYMIENEGAHNILMVVPSISLVKQGFEDFKEYKEFFQTETVWAAGEYCQGSNLTIGTFQTLVRKCDKKFGNKKYDPKFFDKFDVVCVDEAHTLKCESIKSILSQDFMKRLRLKFGFSGSLPDPDSIESFCCQSLMGPVIQDIGAKELMDQGFITPVEIHQIKIKHELDSDLLKRYIECGEYLCSNYKTDEDGKRIKLDDPSFTMKEVKTLPVALKEARKLYNDDEYMKFLVDLCKAKGSNLLMLEQMLLHQDKKRLDVMYDLLFSFTKNCIVFAHHTEYLNFLEKYFKEKMPYRKVFKITGATSVKKRKEIMDALLESNDCILFASYGVLSTGLTLKNLDYGIFAQSFKSKIINKQSIGRGLCLANDKDKYRLYDLIDVYPTGRIEAQGKEKMKLYKNEKFECYSSTV